jgi:CrcB protein
VRATLRAVRLLWIFLGGGVGSALRYAIAGLVQNAAGASFPWGTLTVNVVGCFVIGLLATWLDVHPLLGPEGRLFLLVGMLGGFTTFSTFGLETLRLLEASQWGLAAVNALGSVALGLLAVAGGVALGRLAA